MLFEEGDPADDVFTITAGMIKLYKLMSDGRRQIVGFLVPGDFLGLAFGRTYVYSAEAVVATTTCRFRPQQFLALLDACPTLEKEILTRTATELAAAQEQMLLLGRKTARERVASFVLALARRRQIEPDQPFELADEPRRHRRLSRPDRRDGQPDPGPAGQGAADRAGRRPYDRDPAPGALEQVAGC